MGESKENRMTTATAPKDEVVELIPKREGNHTIWASQSAHEWFDALEKMNGGSMCVEIRDEVTSLWHSIKTLATILFWLPVFRLLMLAQVVWNAPGDVRDW